jgi:hypothetical protein
VLDDTHISYFQRALRNATERIEIRYQLSLRRGIADPVILVLDLRDDIGMGIATLLSGPEAPAEVLAEAPRRGVDVIPLAVAGVPKGWAARVLAPYQEQVSAALMSPDEPGQFPTVIVGAGAAILVPMPVPDFTGSPDSGPAPLDVPPPR